MCSAYILFYKGRKGVILDCKVVGHHLPTIYIHLTAHHLLPGEDLNLKLPKELQWSMEGSHNVMISLPINQDGHFPLYWPLLDLVNLAAWPDYSKK